MAKDKNQLNFLPEDYLERRRQQRTNILCLALFAVVMVGLVAAFMLSEKREASASERRETVNEQLALVGQQLARIEEMERKKQQMIRKANVTASLLERRPRSYVMAEITNALPPGAALMEVDLKSKEEADASDASAVTNTRSRRPSRASAARSAKPESKEPPKYVETLRITGLAPDDKVVSQFIAVLSGSPMFQDVELIFSQEHDYNDSVVRRFMVQMQLNPRLEVTPEMVKDQRLRRHTAFD